MRVLFVCLGNICRSPLAEALFVHKISSLGLHDRFHADSCGTSNYNIGDGPDPRTLKNALRNGVRMDHTARQISLGDFEEFDRILVMDHQNMRNTLAVAATRHHAKIMLMRSFDPLGPGEVPDPYYGSDKDFQEVFEILERSVEGFLQDILRERKI